MKRTNIILCLVALALCAACTNPKAMGEKVAEAYNDCFNELKKGLHNAGNEFVKNFDNNRYTTRIEAKAEFKSKIDNVLSEYETACAKAKNSYSEAELDFIKDGEQLAKFRNAYNAIIKDNDYKSVKKDAYDNDNVKQLILTIIPPLPSEEKIKNDLLGHTLKEPENGYNEGESIWNIEKGDIREFTIKGKKQDGKAYLYTLRTVLQRNGGAIEVISEVRYTLEEKDDWSIELVTTEEFNVVKTGKYKTYIEYDRKDYGCNFINKSDRALMIGGRYLWNSKWRKFQMTVSGNNDRWLGCDDYKIDYIEIPY